MTMNVMHLLADADTGGIELLCKDYSIYSAHHNIFVVLWGENGIYAKLMRSHGGTVMELHADRKKVTEVYRELCAIVRRYAINTVIVHHPRPVMHIYMHLLKIRFGRLKTIAYAHSRAEDMCRRNVRRGHVLKRVVLALAFRHSTQVVAISNAVRQSLIDYFHVPPRMIKVIYNGTDTSRFVPVMDRKADSIRLVYVGRLVREKGVQTTLECLSRVPGNLKWTFDIVGDGTYKADLEQQTVSLGLTDRVHFLGIRNDIPDVLKEEDVFIHMPECEEGFDITVIEAMAAGLLCICSAKGGIPEIIKDHENGILVHSGAELTEVLTHILTNDNFESLNLIRMHAIERAEDFDIRTFTKNLDDAISALS